MADKKEDEKEDEKVAVAPMPAAPLFGAPPAPKSNETVPGGRYIVGGKAVDANGVELGDKITEDEKKVNPPAPTQGV